MNSNNLSKAQNLIKHLCEQPESAYFLHPLDYRGLGLYDYPYVVRTPIDLTSILTWLSQCLYNSIDDFLQDILLVLDNCRAYSLPESQIVKKCDALEEIMLRYCSTHEISLENAMKSPKIDCHSDAVAFSDKVELSEKLKQLDPKRLDLLIDVIETELPQAVTYLNDNTVQIRIDALDKRIFQRIREMLKTEDDR